MKRILAVKLGALGDFVQSMAAVKIIREGHPQAELTLLTTPPFAALGEACPWIDRVETTARPRGLIDTWRLARRLKAARFDRVYDLQTQSRTDLLFQLMRPGAPPWSGTAAGAALRHARADRSGHVVDVQARQLKAAGIAADLSFPAPGPDLSWAAAGVEVEGLRPPAPYALLVPGASPHRGVKRWPAEAYAALAERLRAEGLTPAVIGGPAEADLARAIPAAVDLTGRTDFAQIAALGAGAALCVGNDTGPAHLIAAAGAPTLMLFSAASDPAESAPRRPRVRVLRRDHLSDLSVETVAAAARSLLGDA